MCLTNDPIRRPRSTPLPKEFGDLINKVAVASSAIAQLSTQHDLATIDSSMVFSQPAPLWRRHKTGGGHPKDPWSSLVPTRGASSGSAPAPDGEKGQPSLVDISVAASSPSFVPPSHSVVPAREKPLTEVTLGTLDSTEKTKRRNRRSHPLPPGVTAKNHTRQFATHDYHDHAADTPESLMPSDHAADTPESLMPSVEPSSTQMVTHSRRPKPSPVVLPILEEAICGQYAAFGDEVTAPALPARRNSEDCQGLGGCHGGDQQPKKQRHKVASNESGQPFPRGGVATPFPLKLHNMLTRMDEDGHSDIVSWQPHGRAFCVHQPQKFVAEVMPKYFRQSKLSSFQRQLNLYGYGRLTTGLDKGSYYHELFLRGKPFLCRKMRRTRIKGTGVRTASSPETEPDFYNMAPIDKEGHAQRKCVVTREMASPPTQTKASPARKLARHSHSLMQSNIPVPAAAGSRNDTPSTNPPLRAMGPPPRIPNISVSTTTLPGMSIQPRTHQLLSTRSLSRNKEFLPSPPLSPAAVASSSSSSSHCKSPPTIAVRGRGAELHLTETLPFRVDNDHCFNSSKCNSLGESPVCYYKDLNSLVGQPFQRIKHGKHKHFEEPPLATASAVAASNPFLMTGQCSPTSAGTIQIPSLSASSCSYIGNSDNDACTGRADPLMMSPPKGEGTNNADRDDELLKTATFEIKEGEGDRARRGSEFTGDLNSSDENALYDFLSGVDMLFEADSDSRVARHDSGGNGAMKEAVMEGIQCDESLGLLLDKVVE